MNESDTKYVRWFAPVVALLALMLLCTLTIYGGKVSPDIDADVEGRLCEVDNWLETGRTPSLSRGPLHLYFLRLDRFLFGDAHHFDNFFAALFLFFYILLIARLAGPAVALGCGLATAVHPTFFKWAVLPSGFMPFYALLALALWALVDHFKGEKNKVDGRFLVGVLALSLSMFVRFEGLFFLGAVFFWQFTLQRWRNLAAGIGVFVAVTLLIWATTYLSLPAFLRGATLFVGANTKMSLAMPGKFAAFLLDAFGAFPLIAGIATAFILLRKPSFRFWSLIYLVYFALVVALHLLGRFQYDLDRYYLFLLFGFLPFFGAMAKSIAGEKRPRLATAFIVTVFITCFVFYGLRTWSWLAGGALWA